MYALVLGVAEFVICFLGVKIIITIQSFREEDGVSNRVYPFSGEKTYGAVSLYSASLPARTMSDIQI